MGETWKGIALAAALLLLLPAYASAAPADKKFPNDKDGATVNVSSSGGGNMWLYAKIQHCPSVKTAAIPLAASTAGEDVTLASMNALTSAAQSLVGNPYTCNGIKSNTCCCGPWCLPGPAPCNVPDNDCSDETVTPAIVTCSQDCPGGGGGLNGFNLTRKNAVALRMSPVAPSVSISLLSKTEAGNTISDDLLPNELIRIDKQGVDGNVTIGVVKRSSPGTVSEFTVDTTGKSDFALHQEIAIELGNLGVNAKVRKAISAANDSSFPEQYSGYYLFLPGFGQASQGNKELLVGAEKDMLAIAESTTGPHAAIPTLNEWGLIILIAVLLLSAAWMLQRRRARGHGTA